MRCLVCNKECEELYPVDFSYDMSDAHWLTHLDVCDECMHKMRIRLKSFGNYLRNKIYALKEMEAKPLSQHSDEQEPEYTSTKQSKWVIKEGRGCWWYECPVCGAKPLYTQWGGECTSRFCPDCGTEMIEAEAPDENRMIL